MSLAFTRPSVWRAVSWIIAVAAVCCVILGIALSIGVIVTNTDTEPTPTDDYVYLFIVCIMFWAPMYLLEFWWISIPAIIGLGALAACVRRAKAADQGTTLPPSPRRRRRTAILRTARALTLTAAITLAAGVIHATMACGCVDPHPPPPAQRVPRPSPTAPTQQVLPFTGLVFRGDSAAWGRG